MRSGAKRAARDPLSDSVDAGHRELMASAEEAIDIIDKERLTIQSHYDGGGYT